MSELNLKVLGARVIIKLVEQQAKTASGIVLSKPEEINKGTIILKGPGYLTDKGELIPMDVEIGDLICFNNWAGSPIKKDSPFLVLNYSDILYVELGDE
jgi:chaperonin GroES